jgi:integrase/recombinase XerD
MYKMGMPLTLYRRHTKRCPALALGLDGPALRAYTSCTCPIWIYGHLDNGDYYERESLGLTDWKAAEAKRDSLYAQAKDVQVHGPRISECITLYLQSRKHELSPKTLGQYTLYLDRLCRWCASRGVHFMSELGVDLVERFKFEGLPEVEESTRGLVVAKVRAFLSDAHRRGWMAEHLAHRVRPHHSEEQEPGAPFTPEELQCILAGTARMGHNGDHGYASVPETFRLLLELMLETGMRCGDAVQYSPSNCKLGTEGAWIYRFTPQKSRRDRKPKAHEVFLSPALKLAIDGCRWLSQSHPFAWAVYGGGPSYLAGEVGYRMRAIGKKCGIENCRPHRLRDTFAVNALLAGVSLTDVSHLLGHSSVTVTERHYAKWVPARSRRLQGLVASTLHSPRAPRA